MKWLFFIFLLFVNSAIAETKIGDVYRDKFNFESKEDFPITFGDWKLFKNTEFPNTQKTLMLERNYLLNLDENSPNVLIGVTKSKRTSINWANAACQIYESSRHVIFFSSHGSKPSHLKNKCSAFYFYSSYDDFIKRDLVGQHSTNRETVKDALWPRSFNGSFSVGVSYFVISSSNNYYYSFTSYFLYPNFNGLNKETLFKKDSGEYKAIQQWHEEYMTVFDESLFNKKFKSFAQFDKASDIQKFFASRSKDSFASQERIQVETTKPSDTLVGQENRILAEQKVKEEFGNAEGARNKEQRERLAQEANLVSNTSPTSAASMWLPVFNLPRCEGSDVASWNGCMGVIYQQGLPFLGQFRNGSPYGQLEKLANTETQIAQVNTSPQLEVAQLNAQEKQRLENEKLRVEAAVAKQRQQELEEQLRQAQEARKQEQDRILAEQKAAEQKRLFEESRIKEQQRLALEASEISRLRADAEESKRKQAELEEQLRLAKLQNQVSPPSAMTTMANRKALVIGNDTYKSVTKLLNAREDAKAIASNLTAVGYKVTLQLDLNEKEMKAALRTFSSQVQGGDEVMFFFAGHGVQLGATNYLLPTDIGGESEAQVKDEAIQLQRVLDDMTEKKAKFTLAMIDACRDNPFKSMGRNIGGRGLAPTTAATGQMVVFSAGSGQQALDRLGSSDKNKNGVFTRTFLKEMQKSGISIDRIVKNVRNEVAELAKTIGHEQVPAIYDQVLGDFYFKK